MNAGERWEEIQRRFRDALGRDPSERKQWLRPSEPGDAPDLDTEVESLLAAHEQRGVLDRLMDDLMVPLLPANDQGEMALPSHSRYRVIERLGGGGMGVVYRARDDRLERDVALKFLPPHLSADRNARQRLIAEARVAAVLEHPNICTVHEIDETEDGQVYIVMACYDGETLDRTIARGPLPLDTALHIAADVSRALAQAHQRGIVHRDVKPANVMITSSGHTKLLDFGIARLTGATGTATGVAGTMAYMSPEQAFGEMVDHRTDIWSLGVVLYEMLTGTRPFNGSGDHALLAATLVGEPDPIELLRTDVPPEVVTVVNRALAKRPGDRFSNAAEMLAALMSPNHAPVTEADGPGTKDERKYRESALTRGGERRQVTIVTCVFADGDEGPMLFPVDEADPGIVRIRALVADLVAEHGGVLNHCRGGELQLLFGVPAAHDDDAVRAVRATLALHAAASAGALEVRDPQARPLLLRSGIHTGPVVMQRGEPGNHCYSIAGEAADIAADLAARAEADTILLSHEALKAVGPFVESEELPTVPACAERRGATARRVVDITGARSRLDIASCQELTPFSGREHEMVVLNQQLAAAGNGAGWVTLISGEAGAGKSRLLHELRTGAASAHFSILVGRCDPNGGATPFLPFVETVQQALGVPGGLKAQDGHELVVSATRAIDKSLEQYLPLYLTLLAIPSESHPIPGHLRGDLFQAAMFEAIAALLTLDAQRNPTVLLLEDWHWADEASRTALRQLTGIVSDFPILVVITTRPDRNPDWSGADNQTLLHLPPLDEAATATIAGAAFGSDRVAGDLATRLHQRTGGNPFFLEELCEALREEGAVVVRDGEAIALDRSRSLQVPETVQGVLRTRIDRLDEDASDVLRVAAVIGREFDRTLLGKVATIPASKLGPALERLKESGLVQQFSVVPEAVYRFKHVLTLEVAYDSLLEHQRAMLHAAAGGAIEQLHHGRLEEHVERLAHHFSRANAWHDAVRYGLLSADRAAGLSRNSEALLTLERVEESLTHLSDDLDRRDLLADVLLRQERLCESLGMRSRQLSLVERLIALLASRGPSERLAQVYLRQGDAFTLMHRFEAAERALDTARRIAVERHDDAGERNALRSMALLRTHEGRHQEALREIERVIAMGRAAGDFRAEAGDLATMANILRGMGRLDQALSVLESALDRSAAVDNPVRYSALLNVIGTVHRDLGNYDTALEYFRKVTSTGLEQRHPVNASFTIPLIAHTLLQQGHQEEALETYREAVAINRKAGYVDGSAHASRSFGEVLFGLGRYDEALPLLRDAAGYFGRLEDVANQALMLQRVAIAHERLRSPDEAHATWLRVRELSRGIDGLASEAESLEGLARVERMLGRDDGTVIDRYREALAIAIRINDRKRELAIRNSLGVVHWTQGAWLDAVHQYEAALRICREREDLVHEGLILNSLGASLHRLGRWDEARTSLTDAVRVNGQTGERLLRAHALATLGEVCLASGRVDEAQEHILESLAIRRELDDRRGEGWMLETLARVHRAGGAEADVAAAVRAATMVAAGIDDPRLNDAIARLANQDVENTSLSQ